MKYNTMKFSKVSAAGHAKCLPGFVRATAALSQITATEPTRLHDNFGPALFDQCQVSRAGHADNGTTPTKQSLVARK